MTTKQLNFKSLPELAVNDNATSPNLGVKGKGAIVYSTTLGKALMWDGAKWSSAGLKGDTGASGATASVATTSANGLMASTDKAKLDGVSAGANNYAHPANHPASIITQDASNRFVTDAEKTTWNAKLGAVKTINGQSIVGTGDLVVAGSSTFATDIIVNGLIVGRSANGFGNTAIGQNVLINNTSNGYGNTAVGSHALHSNLTGKDNTAIGQFALYGNTNGGANTALGIDTLRFNTDGTANTAAGQESLYRNTTGNSNTAFGVRALYSNTTGNNNTAVGRWALDKNINGVTNTAVGYQSLYQNTSGNYNTAAGTYALENNKTGSANTAFGEMALRNNIGGVNNTAVGLGALANYESGNGNTAIGRNSLSFRANGNYNIALGDNSLSGCQGNNNIGIFAQPPSGNWPVFQITTHNNIISMGGTAVTNAYIQVAWTVVSDARDKTNFALIPHGLEFVKKLKPTAYQFRESREDDTPHGGVRYGFKAQDIAAIEPEAVIVDTTNPEKFYYNESNLIAVLVKAVQELTAKVERLENANSNT